VLKPKTEKDAIPLKLKSRFKVAAIKSAEDIAAERREIESDSFNRTLSPKDVQIKVQESLTKRWKIATKLQKNLMILESWSIKPKALKTLLSTRKNFLRNLKN
jgi:hypothetical protein